MARTGATRDKACQGAREYAAAALRRYGIGLTSQLSPEQSLACERDADMAAATARLRPPANTAPAPGKHPTRPSPAAEPEPGL